MTAQWPNASLLSRKEALLSRREIENLIANGRKVIIVDGKVLKVDAWLKYHPGGDKAIMHMIGRDATDEVNALHSPEARRRLDAFQIGRIQSRWKNFLPPIQGGQFRSFVGGADTAEVATSESASSSSKSSRSGSPVFDPPETLNTTIRRNYTGTHRDGDGSSVSSLSSLDLCAPPKTEELSRIDAYTRKELDLDLEKYPSLDLDTQSHIVQKYRALNDRIRAEGLYNCNYHAYALELCRYTFLFASMLLLLRYGQYTISGLCLGMFWHQLVFTAHDAGHMGITHSFTADTIIGILVADFLGGLSLGWWKRNHNVHHIVTNAPEHDPDIEHMPFFAVSHRFLASLRSSYYDRIMPYDALARLAVPWQRYLYYPLLTLGRFNLYRLSWEYLLLGPAPTHGPAWWHRHLELAGQAFFWSWFGYGILYRAIPTLAGRLAFVLASHLITAPLHLQITLSHFAMSTADLGVDESFPQKMLRTTMDVDCPPWLDFFHGGLQFQAVHHLYPRIPRHNLRRTQGLVRAFCAECGIPYALFGFVEGNQEVLGRLGEVGRQARILGACQRVADTEALNHEAQQLLSSTQTPRTVLSLPSPSRSQTASIDVLVVAVIHTRPKKALQKRSISLAEPIPQGVSPKQSYRMVNLIQVNFVPDHDIRPFVQATQDKTPKSGHTS